MTYLLQEALPEHSTSLPQSSRALSKQISAKDSASDPNCSTAKGLTQLLTPLRDEHSPLSTALYSAPAGCSLGAGGHITQQEGPSLCPKQAPDMEGQLGPLQVAWLLANGTPGCVRARGSTPNALGEGSKSPKGRRMAVFKKMERCLIPEQPGPESDPAIGGLRSHRSLMFLGLVSIC